MASNKLNERKVFTLRLGDEWYQKMDHIAKEEHRTATNVVELAVMRYIASYEAEHGTIEVGEEE